MAYHRKYRCANKDEVSSPPQRSLLRWRSGVTARYSLEMLVITAAAVHGARLAAASNRFLEDRNDAEILAGCDRPVTQF